MKTSFRCAALTFIFAAALTSGVGQAQSWKATHNSPVPSAGYVPDEATASAIAEAILVPIYGRPSIDRQKPFNVSLDNDVWTVSGQMRKVEGHVVKGGVFRIEISKQDGSVKAHSHGK